MLTLLLHSFVWTQAVNCPG